MSILGVQPFTFPGQKILYSPSRTLLIAGIKIPHGMDLGALYEAIRELGMKRSKTLPSLQTPRFILVHNGNPDPAQENHSLYLCWAIYRFGEELLNTQQLQELLNLIPLYDPSKVVITPRDNEIMIRFVMNRSLLKYGIWSQTYGVSEPIEFYE